MQKLIKIDYELKNNGEYEMKETVYTVKKISDKSHTCSKDGTNNNVVILNELIGKLYGFRFNGFYNSVVCSTFCYDTDRPDVENKIKDHIKNHCNVIISNLSKFI